MRSRLLAGMIARWVISSSGRGRFRSFIGVSLGALGGGGSILAVPALVFAAGQSPRHATTTSLVLVGITALIGLVPYWRAHQVRFAAGAIFGLAGIGRSLLGSHWNNAADPDVLLLAFADLMLVAAYGMWRRLHRSPRAVARSLGAAASTTAPAPHIASLIIVKVAAAGTLVGLLTGFFGVGGGFIIVPALVLTLGFTMPEATATSLLVIAINSAVALTARLDGAAIEWGTIIPFTAASVLGVIVGTKLVKPHNPATLQRWFIALLVIVALYTATRSAVALT